MAKQVMDAEFLKARMAAIFKEDQRDQYYKLVARGVTIDAIYILRMKSDFSEIEYNAFKAKVLELLDGERDASPNVMAIVEDIIFRALDKVFQTNTDKGDE